MRLSARLTGADAPANLCRRLEAELETGRPPRLEGRFKDRRGFSANVPGGRFEAGDLRPAPRPEPRSDRRSDRGRGR